MWYGKGRKGKRTRTQEYELGKLGKMITRLPRPFLIRLLLEILKNTACFKKI